MNISGKTRICALIGDPVEHTMSPVMHNTAFEKLGLDMAYLAFRVTRENLAFAVNGLRALDVRGFNVTIPHKVNVIPLLDGVDPLAEKIGAVNTVVNEGGRFIGSNTDAAGFLRALTEKGIEPKGKNIVIIGAGGASRAISYILAGQGTSLTIVNRLEELDWAENIAASIKRDLGSEAEVYELTDKNLKMVLPVAEVLVNATSLGMSPHRGRSPVPARLLHPGLTVFDVVYNPLKTRLLQEAEAAGAQTISGLEMLVWQGALAFEKWTGQAAPFEVMRDEVLEMLERHED